MSQSYILLLKLLPVLNYCNFLIIMFFTVTFVLLAIMIPTKETQWMTVFGAVPLAVVPMSEML